MLLRQFADAMTNRDIDVFASILHEDFFYIEGTTMETRDEWLQATAEMFESSDHTSSNWDVTARFETKDMGAVEYTTEKNGRKMRVLNAFIYRDGKVYRQLISRVPIE